MALNDLNIVNEWINFPQNINKLQHLRARIFRKYNFPGIVGCIDCIHVAIVGPNVQLICDENLRIMNVVNRFPGSAHDAHIWRQCNISTVMEMIYRENPQNIFFYWEIQDIHFDHGCYLL